MRRSLILVVAVMFILNITAIFFVGHRKAPTPSQQPTIGGMSRIPPEKEKPKVEPVKPPQRALPDFVQIQKHRQSEEGTVYGDIISHSKGKPFGDQGGRGTNAHETTHGINSEIRNAHTNQGKKINGFYVLEGRGVVLEEPKIKMEHAKKFVPKNLQSYRWDLYLVKQLRDWNDTPTYICDEWVAYINGGACDVDDVKKGKHKGGWTDGVSGCCDFTIYTIALCMATKELDPDYWKNYKQFRNFVVWEMRFAQKIFLEGRVMKEFKWDKQDKLLLEFLESPEAEAMRKFVREELDGVWLDINPADIKKTSFMLLVPEYTESRIDREIVLGLNITHHRARL
jgi:hypothetical protein